MTLLTFRVRDIDGTSYADACNNLLSLFVVFFVFHILMYVGYNGKKLYFYDIFSNKLFNGNIINVFVFLLLGVLSYYMVVRKIILFI